MPRPLVVGNGKMLINFDEKLQMRDLYYPYVGQLNHIGGHPGRIGVWTEGSFVWLSDDSWAKQLDYAPESLVTNVSARHDGLGISLRIEDGMHQRETIYLKRVSVRNDRSQQREIRLFFHHDFSLHETEVGDTAVYDPLLHTVYHYKRDVYVMINGKTPTEGLFQYSIGIKRFHYAQGTWKDAEDGLLEGNSIAQGSVDSTVSFRLSLEPHEEQVIHYWICVGDSYSAVKKQNQYVLDNDPERLLQRVKVYWQRWVNKETRPFANLPEEVISLYKKSLLIVRTQIDQRGAIIAANDSDILQFNRDHYSYMWPRDGALIALAMCRAGYSGIVAPFFQFCSDALTKGGYLLHKYNPDGSVGSSWHPFIQNGETQLPIQEDESALVLYALWEYYNASKQIEFCQNLYASLIRPIAKFLLTYIDPQLSLPMPSYDLWEERRGIFTFTSSSVFAGIKAAANFAKLFGDDDRQKRYEVAAEKVRDGMLKHLYSQAEGRFLRGIYVDRSGTIAADPTVESSLFSLFSFGVLSASDPKVINTMAVVKEKLRIQTEIGGFARYQEDAYFRKSYEVERIPGNPWIISTLWMAEWEIESATEISELNAALDKLKWVVRHSMESGVLPEQLDPYTGGPISVAPLTWSHSTYVLTVVKYLEKYYTLVSAGRQ